MPPVNNQSGTAGWVKNRSMLLLFPGIHVVDSVISPIEVSYSRQEIPKRLVLLSMPELFSSNNHDWQAPKSQGLELGEVKPYFLSCDGRVIPLLPDHSFVV